MNRNTEHGSRALEYRAGQQHPRNIIHKCPDSRTRQDNWPSPALHNGSTEDRSRDINWPSPAQPTGSTEEGRSRDGNWPSPSPPNGSTEDRSRDENWSFPTQPTGSTEEERSRDGDRRIPAPPLNGSTKDRNRDGNWPSPAPLNGGTEDRSSDEHCSSPTPLNGGTEEERSRDGNWTSPAPMNENTEDMNMDKKGLSLAPLKQISINAANTSGDGRRRSSSAKGSFKSNTLVNETCPTDNGYTSQGDAEMAELWYDAVAERDTEVLVWFDAIDANPNSLVNFNGRRHSSDPLKAGSVRQIGCFNDQDEWHDAVEDGHDDSNDMWYDALNQMTDVALLTHTADKHVIREPSKQFSDSGLPSSDSGTIVHDDSKDKLLNMSGKNLPQATKTMLCKGPNFALSRTINKHVIREAEIGVERCAFALRWGQYIEERRTQQHPPPHAQQHPLTQHDHQHTPPAQPTHQHQQQHQHQPPPQHQQPEQQDTPLVHSQHLQHSQQDSRNTTQSQRSQQDTQHVPLIPRFSDTDTRMAPTASSDTEGKLQKLKQKVINLYKHHHSTTPNHTEEDALSLKEIRNDESRVVKRSDKCKGFVLMDKETYIEKAKQITKEYKPVEQNPTKKLEVKTKALITKTMKDKVPTKTIRAINPSCSRTAELYGLPKNHKADTPLRPIVSAAGNPLDKLSWFLERIIHQLLFFVPAHLQNTYDYLDRLHAKFPHGFPPGSIAFSVDVTNLYGNIPTSEAISFTLDLMKRHLDKINLFGLTLKDVKVLLEHCLNNNFIRFGKNYYKQTTGIAMGSRIAPPLAIVFMNAVESLILASDKILQPVLYLRYIDDVIGIWTHGAHALDRFFDFINNFHQALSFTIERTDHNPLNQLAFLDTLLTVKPNGKFTTELYIKPMAAPIILHYESAHPKRTKHSVLYSQMLRAMRLGSSTECKNRGMDKIQSLFVSNAYPLSLIQRTRHRVITQHTHAPTHTARNTPHRTTQHTYMSLPYVDETLLRRVEGAVKSSKLPLRVAWRSGKTLAKYLTKSALEPPPCPAGNRKCHTCEAGLAGKCHTKNVVYKITCNHCPCNTTTGTYIGETRRSVRERFMEHLREFKSQVAKTPFGDHRRQCHEDATITPTSLTIEILQVCKDTAELKITESIHIRNQRPSLNTQTSSWRLIPPVQYTTS